MNLTPHDIPEIDVRGEVAAMFAPALVILLIAVSILGGMWWMA